MAQSSIQLGKNRITDNFIETIKAHFKKHDNVKIDVLKSAEHKKEKIKMYSKDMLERLGKNYTAKIIGFTIFIKKWRKSKR